MSRITLVQGDITALDAFAIVNAANSALAGGGGVDGAIHRKAGPQLLAECRGLAPCAPGEARLTRGYLLKARYVIHTVGPVWEGGHLGEAEQLARCYRSSLTLAEEKRMPDVAFPAISTGIFRYPMRDACTIAAREAADWLDAHEWPRTVTFCMFDARAAAEMQGALTALARPDLT